MDSSPDAKTSAAISQMTADLRTTGAELPGVSPEIADAAAAAGFQSATGTIAFAGQYSSGAFAVQFNVLNGGGFSSTWPQWAFELAKDALLGNKRVWVASNGDPFGSNLVFVLILP
ncbi:MAG: hypothetical protein JWO93_3142 [Micrococcaceae bacterium]|nr:hypothetical protein [Micrococcaceae bacterium]